jgi:hypothetical protein
VMNEASTGVIASDMNCLVCEAAGLIVFDCQSTIGS